MSDVPEGGFLADLGGLDEWCSDNEFDVEEIDSSELVLTDQDTGSVWSVFGVDDWIQIKGLVLEEVEPGAALCITLARLHDRLLGCRFSVDAQHGLVIIVDLMPSCRSAAAIAEAIIQMQAIIDHTSDLLEDVVSSGVEADDRKIDQAFGLEGSRRLH
ncbi:hypothetical protein [Novosphingobium sp.]|uniref:hypothetical protein n=1 Tax=Novosphingobium sp. TaxID=1874826 RepID=UPI0028A68CB0|nr:hypothetical protein [Novosphingobium sp.]